MNILHIVTCIVSKLKKSNKYYKIAVVSRDMVMLQTAIDCPTIYILYEKNGIT